ncbi:amphi-Trp domain-containing protein [Roseibium denhamense]|uniref:Amphi-Trp domain-containing protein n=1 Tax=Roseibium denhamense TaxID=76305 RepID=A0ABY1NI96_9HYPH|nr:amphi-Trp domain-containing protein [Roseibium denhamense]MTI06489.1 amphi-Trp domain-containing protein [Roseibium denhamense]SMP09529.1 amphi-Trp domain-containing protein [Roseibium denhamense]
MMERKGRFRHHSLQDKKSIQKLLDAIKRGIQKGELEFGDDTGGITLEPNGLLNLRVTATAEEDQSRLDLRITWTNDTSDKRDSGKLKVK